MQLAQHFLEQTCKDFGREVLTLTRAQTEILRSYPWPGNVRELKNVIERAVILSQGKVLRLDLSMPALGADGSPDEDAPRGDGGVLTEKAMKEFQRTNIVRGAAAGELARVGQGWRRRAIGRAPDHTRRPDKNDEDQEALAAMMNRTTINRLAISLAFVALAYSLYLLPFADWVAATVTWAQEHPVAGPSTYILCVVLATVLFVPGSVSMMIGGFLFGLVPGFVMAAIGISLGAQSAFMAGRKGARHWVERRAAASRRLTAIEKGLQEEAFLIVVLTRLSLVIPFNLLNYAYGVTSVRSGTHLVATTLGMLPAVALYVYLGTLARDIGQILSGEATPTELGYWIAAAGITGIIVLTWAIHRTASRALDRHLPELESKNAD